MHTTATVRPQPSDSRRSLFPMFRTWLRAFGGRQSPKFSKVALPKGHLQRIGVSAGTALACARGTLWVTDAHGWEAVLEAGDARVFAHEEELLVEALAPALFTVGAEAVSV